MGGLKPPTPPPPQALGTDCLLYPGGLGERGVKFTNHGCNKKVVPRSTTFFCKLLIMFYVPLECLEITIQDVHLPIGILRKSLTLCFDWLWPCCGPGK